MRLLLSFLLSTIFITHKPSSEDCQHLFQVLFTSEEVGWIQIEARKHVLEQDGLPNDNIIGVDKIFPLTSPAWNPNANQVMSCCVLVN